MGLKTYVELLKKKNGWILLLQRVNLFSFGSGFDAFSFDSEEVGHGGLLLSVNINLEMVVG